MPRTPMTPDLETECRAAGIAPDLIERIAARYRAYAAHTDGRADALGLSDWFKWYAVENASQLKADGIAVPDCSVAGDAAPIAGLERRRQILSLLERRLAATS